jgi:hypothetical protein
VRQGAVHEELGIEFLFADTRVTPAYVFGVARLGATAFTGPSRKALGFSHFYSIGYSMGLDVAERSRYFEGLTLGAQYNFGKDVDGFSLVFGWQLK